MLTSEDTEDPLSVVHPGNVFVGTDNPIRIWIELRISNGLHLSQKNLSYWDLVRMVEKPNFKTFLMQLGLGRHLVS